MNSRHIVLTGDAAEDLGDVAALLRGDGNTVTVGKPVALGAHPPVTSFIIVARFASGMEWDTWWAQDAHDREAFEAVLPHLAPASNGMLIGLSATGDRSERAEIRAGM